MPKLIPWQDTALGIDGNSADVVLDGMKAFEITKSNKMACTVCSDVEPHHIRHRLLECCSQACETETLNGYSSPKKKKLSATQNAFCRDLSEHHLRPIRIRHAMARKFDTNLEDLPALSTIQNFVNHHARTKLENNDRVDGVKEWIHAHAFTGGEATTQPFTFGWDLDSESKPVVGNGSEERPFMI
ncbi:hypothetical protein PHPALM_30533 [Phytophthora palmivora]|uniref:Uncharacterized protein n=1 Tax=Phytophthora palmivora TaxID=4796 RepID=A0A2P4X4W9_9STRA|nr:hypothetical protein PHPALM_30533 [Phytophthora palmivora]